jgi:polysaccharide biosynthesis protein PslH
MMAGLNGSKPFDLVGANGTQAKPKLLFLCQTLPFPPDGGAHLRSYNILRLLAQAFDVTALCFYRKATRPTANQVAEGLAGLGAISEVEAFPIPQEISRPRLIWDHLRSVMLGNPYTRYAYESAEFTKRLREMLAKRKFDIVHMDSLDLSVYLPLLEGIPVVCTHHNVE